MDLETENCLAALLMEEARRLRAEADKEGVHAYLRQPNVRGRPNSRFLTATVLGVQQGLREEEVPSAPEWMNLALILCPRWSIMMETSSELVLTRERKKSGSTVLLTRERKKRKSNLKSAFLGKRSDILCTNSPVIKIGNRKPIQCKESRIGKRPIEVPSNVNITLEGQDLKVKGPLGELSRTYPREVKLELEESGILKVSKAMDTRRANQMHGLFRIDRREYIFPYERTIQCSLGDTTSKTETITKHLLSCFAASVMFISAPNQVIAAVTDNGILKFDDEKGSGMLMMRGMTANNFDPVRYSGRWFEVASLKRGFAGQGQEDCHCTQGIYTFDGATPAIQVDTFCIHGGPDGYITGIRGKVQCVSEEELGKTETDLERQEMIREKCYLRFPTLPFIPKEPYDVIATDYDNFALVSGAKDRSFVQIYSRTPTPGPPFIEKYKSYLANYGYDPSKIKDTPQDCEVMSNSQLALMMSKSGMQQALTNQFPDLELKSAVEFNPFTSVFETFKKLLALYFK